MANERSFPDTFINEDPQKALEELNGALEESSNNAEWLCQRAYAHILLKNYSRAADDAKTAQQLQPGLALAFLRTGIAEYHLNNFQSASEALLEGQKLDGSDDSFQIWLERCDHSMQTQTQNGATNTQPAAAPPVKYDWYQTESQVIMTIMLKNAKNEDVRVSFEEKELTACVKLALGEDYYLKLCLLHAVVPEQCTYRILSTKIEIKMKKTEAIRWEKLEGEGVLSNVKHFTPNQYPSSGPYTRNWDKLVGDIKEEEKNEKLEGDAALNKLFQQIYTDGSDEVKRAMNKSFMESGGTVLSTNWTDVGKRNVDMSPPEDVEFKKF
ncbi:protein SGT1 homolog isoform X2 [Clupea harengus]|uniref:Protein SGT1 homolog isoform X2 n=1 Tax=Clupea harengus TaxID=7950 RepID=A0A6P8EQX0_CLUHA|nr:protein SGT1 homolog isoform X2 [Clupea harengus]